MNRLLIIAATGFLALLLTACGDNGASKPADEKTDTTVVVPADDKGTTTVVTPADENTAKPDEEKSN